MFSEEQIDIIIDALETKINGLKRKLTLAVKNGFDTDDIKSQMKEYEDIKSIIYEEFQF